MSTPVSACWEAQDARDMFSTEALEGDDAIFLATHTPIEDFDVAGANGAEFAEQTESAVLETLSAPEREHAFCVVQGEPGSGKSHLIRWLAVNWPRGERDVMLLLRRSDGSLEGALHQLRERLPQQFGSLFQNLGQTHRAGQRGRANIFLGTLTNTLEPGHFEVPLADEGWCREYAPDKLLRLDEVRTRWQGPARILGLMEGSTHQPRNSETASFNLHDIAELAKICAPLERSRVAAPCRELIHQLVRETDRIDREFAENWSADALAKDYKDLFPVSLRFIAALNSRRNDAIQNVLGISAQGLKTLFRRVREALAQQGKRLVLLLEDITSWEGLDDSLIDALVFNAAARGGEEEASVCPLISVVGITPAYYYEHLAANYRQRITHEIRLGKSTGSGLQDVATLRDRQMRRQFVTRYLAAMRAGRDRIDAWLRTVRTDDATCPAPNPCTTCTRRETCFSVFGSNDGIGFFPFTAHALDRFFDALKDNDRGQTWQTPRGILQAILSPNLTQPNMLAAGTYPGPLIESGQAFRSDRCSGMALASRTREIVRNRIEAPVEQSRMCRVLAYWADPERADTTVMGDGLAFAGMSRHLFDAFGLPWIGSESATAAPTSDPLPIIDVPAPDELPVTAPAPAPDSAPASGPAPQAPAMPRRAPSSALATGEKLRPRRTSIPRLEQMRKQIRAWQQTGVMEDISQWNTLVYGEIFSKLNLRQLGYPVKLVTSIITPDMLKVQSRMDGTRDYFVIRPEEWVVKGLEAYIALRQDRDMTSADVSYHLHNLAAMMRHMAQEASQYLDRHIPLPEGGKRWQPVATFAQVLLLRAWLRGTVSPTAPVLAQIRAVLEDEPDPRTDIGTRCAPWQELLNASNTRSGYIRQLLNEMLALPVSEEGAREDQTLVDASVLTGAVARFMENGEFDPFPDPQAMTRRMPDLFRRVCELAKLSDDRLMRINRTETRQLNDRVQALSDMLERDGIVHHLDRMKACITAISDLLPAVIPVRVAEWMEEYARLAPRIEEGAPTQLEELICDVLDGEMPADYPKPVKLGWLARVPSRNLEEFLKVTQSGTDVLRQLYTHAHDCVAEAQGLGSLSAVHAIGHDLKEVAGHG